MAWGTPTAIGTNNAATTSPVAVTVTSAVSAGSLIVVAVGERATTLAAGAVTDTKGNTYSTAGRRIGGSSAVQIFYAFNVTALTVSDTITFTSGSTSVTRINYSAFFITGTGSNDPLDAGATNNASGATVTSGLPATSGELFVALVGSTSSSSGSQSAGWTTPPSGSGSANFQTVAGNLINAGSGTETYTPGSVGSQPVAVIVAFQLPPVSSGGPAGWLNLPDVSIPSKKVVQAELMGLMLPYVQQPPSLWGFPFTQCASGGTITGASSGAVTVTSTVPQGALIVVVVGNVGSGGVTGSVSDSKGNNYSRTIATVANGTSQWTIFYAFNAISLVNGTDTITYTYGGTSTQGGFTAAWITGSSNTDPQDYATAATVTGTTNASGKTPLFVQSGVPAKPGELFVAMAGVVSNNPFPQDTDWLNPPNFFIGAGVVQLQAGGLINPNTAVEAYTPVTGQNNVAWGAIIGSFKLPDIIPSIGWLNAVYDVPVKPRKIVQAELMGIMRTPFVGLTPSNFFLSMLEAQLLAPSKKQQWLDYPFPFSRQTTQTPSTALPIMMEQEPPVASKKQQWLDLPFSFKPVLPITPSVFWLGKLEAQPPTPSKKQLLWHDPGVPISHPTLPPTPDIFAMPLPDVSVPSLKQQWLELFLPIYGPLPPTPTFALPMLPDRPQATRAQQWLDLPFGFLPVLAQTPSTFIMLLPDMSMATRQRQGVDLGVGLPIFFSPPITSTPNTALPMMLETLMQQASRKYPSIDLPLPYRQVLPITPSVFAMPVPDMSVATRAQQWLDILLAFAPTSVLTPLVALPMMPDMPVATRAQQWLDLALPILLPGPAHTPIFALPLMLEMQMARASNKQQWLEQTFRLPLILPPTPAIFFDTRFFDGPRQNPMRSVGDLYLALIGKPPPFVPGGPTPLHYHKMQSNMGISGAFHNY